jgi:ubiquinone biosynthesis protein UbiJ
MTPVNLLQEAVNVILRLDPDTLARLGEFDGRCIRLRLARDATDLECFVFPSAAGLRLRATHDAAPDVTIRGDVPVFTRLVFGGGATARAGELQIGGDIELGQRFQRLLREIDIDWEEHAAQLMGDVLAHQLGRAARALRAWGRSSAAFLRQDLREYLQEESRLLAPRPQVEAFLRAVDGLRADVDRLEKRLERLAGRTG